LWLSFILCITYLPSFHFLKSDVYRIIDVKSNYAIIENRESRIVVYTTSTLPFDAEVEVSNHIYSFEYDSKFYGFSLYQWAKENEFSGYTYQSELKVIQQRFTLRSWIQKQIEKVSNNLQKEMLYQIIFHIKSKGIDITDIYEQSGFSYVAGTWLLLYVIKFFTTQQQRKIIKVLCLIVLNIFYHYSIVLVYSLSYALLQFFDIPTRVKILLSSIVLLVIYPNAVYSLSFQIPLIYRLQNLFTSQRKVLIAIIVAGICSIKFHSIQILSLLFYPVLRYFMGFTWVMGFVQLWTGFDMVHLVAIVSKTVVKIQSIKLYGNIFGIGIVFPLFMYRSLKHKTFRLHCLSIMLVLMLGLSAIHPLSEVTVLNNPKNTNIILKPSLSNKATVLSLTDKVIDKDLQSYLYAKGITIIHSFMELGNEIEGIDVISSSDSAVVKQLNQMNVEHPIWYFNYDGLMFIVFTYLDQNDITYFLNHYDNLNIDVMILPNHGSSSANPPELFDHIQPKLCISINKPYLNSHLPSRIVIKELKKRGIALIDSGTYGDISFFSIFHKHFALTSGGKIVIIN
jgi:membrane protein